MQEVTITRGYMTIPTYIIGELKSGRDAILFLHGDNTTREKQLELCEIVNNTTGKTVVLPEYSGHGKNAEVAYEDTTPATHVSEVVMAYDWLAEKVEPQNVIVYGGSYGGFLAAKLMYYRNPTRVILQAPSLIFEQDVYTTRRTMPSHGEKIAAAKRSETVRNIADTTEGFTGKLMVMKSENDELVPDQVVDAWKSVYPEADFIMIPGAVHSVRRSSKAAKDAWLKAIVNFVES